MLGDQRITSNLLGIPCDLREGCPLNATCTRPQAKQHTPSGARTTDPVDYLIIVDSPNLEDSYLTQAFSSAENSFFLDPLFEKGSSFAMSFIYRGHFLDKEHHADELSNPSWSLFGQAREVKNFGEFSRKIRTKSSTAAERKPVIQHCMKYLQKDLQLLRPKMIIAVGALVKDALFPTEIRPVNRLFDQVLYYGMYPVRFVTHPASLLRNKSSEKPWYEQFQAVLTGRVVEKDTELGEAKTLMRLDEVRDFIADLKKKQNDIAIDLETENLNKRWGNRIATIQFSEDNVSGVVIPYHHKESPFLPDEIEIIRQDLFDLFSKPSQILHWVGHNLKFECNLLNAVIGTPLLSAPMFDTMIGSFLLDECRRDRVASGEFKYGVNTLKQLCYEYLNFDGYNKEILQVRAEGNLFDLPLDALSEYGCIDTYKSRALMEAEIEEARSQDFLAQFLNLMYCFASPEILLFSKIEQNGFPVDRPHLRNLLSKDSPLLQGIKTIEQELADAKEVIRANDILLHGNLPKGMSPRIMPLGTTPFVFDMGKKGHAQTLFFKVLNLKPGRVGKNGLPSIDDEWQTQNLNNDYVKKYAEWSLYRHMYNTFASKMYNRIDPGGKDVDCNTDGNIRSNYLLSSAVTGRVISKEPNLQQIPRSDAGPKKAIKDAFCTLPGHIMLQVDFKANEMRWAGIVSKDVGMAKNFNLGHEYVKKFKIDPENEELFKKAEMFSDVHRNNAASAFNVPIEEVTKIQRQQAKALGFGVLFDSSEYSIAEMFKMEVKAAKDMIVGFYKKHPHLYQWKLKTKMFAVQNGYVEAPHGRRRRLGVLKSVGPYDIKLLQVRQDKHGKDIVSQVTSLELGEINTTEFWYINPELGIRKSAVGDALRQATNAIIQGIASDSGMVGGTLFDAYIRENNKPWLINNAVHDSVIWQVPYADLEETIRVTEKIFTTDVMEYMTAAFGVEFNLPLDIDFEIGSRWGSIKGWKFNYKELPAIIDRVRSEKGEA